MKRIDDLHIIDEKSGKVVTDKWGKINEDIETANEYTREIMDIIDNKDEMTRSDLQGVVMGVVISLMMRGGDK